MENDKIIYLNDKLNLYTLFSEKLQNQCKKQTNNKAPLTFSHCISSHLEYRS